MNLRCDLLVFSHLRWDFVYQRPQHLLSRLAKGRRVIYVEEPVHEPGTEPHWRRSEPAENVRVCRPCTPIDAAGFADAQTPTLRRLLRQLLVEEELAEYVLWFYTPMALPLSAGLLPRAVVYDCMDELSAFAQAPPELAGREAALLERADVVFTGGPSLYLAKRDRHPNVHCFASSVDALHFGRAREPGDDPPDQQPLPRPRLGYFGVIDERIDLVLLAAMAKARPQWQIVMIGPCAKIDPATLPRADNLHYLGVKDYRELPGYLAGWDVCLLPFARNEATRFISPTKTLEYMAAEKPIVSTPITDVAEPYGPIVYLGESHQAFIEACGRALAAGEQERRNRVDKMRAVLACTSWNATAMAMDAQIVQAVEGKSRATEPSSHRATKGERLDTSLGGSVARGSVATSTLIIGAGPTGLSAAYHLGDEALVLEQHDRVGGCCRSVEDHGFTFDMAGHIMFSKDPDVHRLYEILLGDNVHWQDREAWIFSKGVYTRYPFQGCLHGLPADVVSECLIGAIEARFGSLQSPDAAALSQRGIPAACSNAPLDDCCADGILESEVPLVEPAAAALASGAAPRNFEQFIYQTWGKGIAEHFAIPYNRKLWAVPLTEMETSWLGGRVPMPDLAEMIRNAMAPPPRPMGPNARFGYPLRGGFQALMNGFLPYVGDRLRLNAAVRHVSPARRTVTTRDGRTYRYDLLVSTMPLPVLVDLMGEEAPAEVRRAAAGLRFVSVRCVNLGVGRANLTDKHWIYYPEDTVFHRIFVQGNASPHCNPPGGFGLTCEITYAPRTKPLPCDGDALIQRCIDDCRRVGMIAEEDPIWTAHQTDLPHAYVVYDHARPQRVATIRRWLATQDILLAGRYSEWEYYNSDHAFLAGKRVAEQVRQLRRSREEERASSV